jgi:hypothetical protein
MISSIEWIPAGIADPNPKKYELSSTEQELLQMIDENGNFVTSDAGGATKIIEDSDTEGNQKRSKNGRTKTLLPTIENNLPPDLRMDEYSDDDDDDDEENDIHGTSSAAIGRLLVAGDDDDEGERIEEEYMNDVDEQNVLNDMDNKIKDPNEKDDDDDDDDDDDLDDVPDTREYEPIDVAGLEAMGLGHPHGMMSSGKDDDPDLEDDDESEQEDVALTPDDALIVVAKTEDVRLLCVFFGDGSTHRCTGTPF